MIMAGKVYPLVVIVLVVAAGGVKLIIAEDVPVRLKFVKELDQFPDTFMVFEPMFKIIIPSSADTVRFIQLTEDPSVTVNDPVPTFELALKNTLSAVVGAEAPAAPPSVALQLPVLVVFHVPSPPTQ